MTNEAVPVETQAADDTTTDFTVADGTAIARYALLKLSGARTAILNDGDLAENLAPAFAGIAAADKVASDGATNLALLQDGIFELTAANDNIALGAKVTLSGSNLIATATEANEITGSILGTAMEAITANGTGEVNIGNR